MRRTIFLTVQPYRYNGKELDRTHGLDWYDYGARMFDAAAVVWRTQDPLSEKDMSFSPYAYCRNNPVKFVDVKGMAPGDFFSTIDAAAIDFGMYYNDNSIREKREYGSSIIKVINENGQEGYTYNVANRGATGEVIAYNVLGDFEIVADIHTHGHCTENDPISYNDNDFSGIPSYLKDKNLQNVKNDFDIGLANRTKLDSYLATPNGTLKKYSPKTGKITTISTIIPSDPNDSNRKNANSAYIEMHPINKMGEMAQMVKVLRYKK